MIKESAMILMVAEKKIITLYNPGDSGKYGNRGCALIV
jgi:hypothetical protein